MNLSSYFYNLVLALSQKLLLQFAKLSVIIAQRRVGALRIEPAGRGLHRELHVHCCIATFMHTRALIQTNKFAQTLKLAFAQTDC